MNAAGQADLFGTPGIAGLSLLRGFALPAAESLLAAVATVTSEAPPRRMSVPAGGTMSVEMTNCGAEGWVSDRSGYRYASCDPMTGLPWPTMPKVILDLAKSAAVVAGFAGFAPDACLINTYAQGARMGLHQDRDEGDLTAPIVSISLGLPATFLFGGLKRDNPVQKFVLEHGDIVVWGGPARLAYHGIAPLKAGSHPTFGEKRVNLTIRRARR